MALVQHWLVGSDIEVAPDEREATERLHDLIDDPDGVAFTMQFVDRVIRPDDHRVAADQLASLVLDEAPLPTFLGRVDRLLLTAGARLAPLLPRVVMPLARRRMRQMVGHLVVDAEAKALETHLGARRADGFSLNVNLLGEAVLGEREAERRLAATLALLDDPNIDYVSVKISAVASQLNHWAWDDCIDRITDRLRTIWRAADGTDTFVNLDMEEYHDLELTVEAFCQVLAEPEFLGTEAGIVLQAYLPDSFPALQHLVAWAAERRTKGGADIKIRIVKGANLAMERVDAALHDWELAPYPTKAETDANYKRCVDWVLTPERTEAVRLGIGSHNLFDLAFALLVADERAVVHRVEVEMLEGMAPTHARTIKAERDGLLLYTPIVAKTDFDVAISYLFRRLEENAAPGNFVRSLGDLEPGSLAFAEQEHAFRAAVAHRWQVATGRRRTLDRRTRRPAPPDHFVNDPETDPTDPENRTWARAIVESPPTEPVTPVDDSLLDMETRMGTARAAQAGWSARPRDQIRATLRRVADEFDRRRADLLAAMVHEAGKTVAQGDPEVCEAVDFARYYAEQAIDLDATGARFDPLGVVAVIPPWNFPVAIPAGGVLAALAAGNSVILKPAPETPRCAEIVAECCWAAGVPGEVLQFVRAPENEVGRHLITHADGVVLTGASATAELFRSWRPDLRLFAETSGKNAMVITPNADLDLAVKDLVASAFGHAGQKCSAASLAICVGDVYRSERFRRQLRDAVESLVVGASTDLRTTMNGLITEPGEALERGLTRLEPGEEWLVRPRRLDDRLWPPGVRLGVVADSWFHRTECFGPVLGVMHAHDLDEAIRLQNSSAFGLTGGIQSLDPEEIERWTDQVQVGNAYVNRGITGAIVQRQPFGGWKASSVGPGAKAGGPNYVMQLGIWHPTSAPSTTTPGAWLAAAEADDRLWWSDHFGREHDPTGLFCESNVFRYRPLPAIAMRVDVGTPTEHVERVRSASRRCGVPVIESWAQQESDADFADRLEWLDVTRVRVLGTVSDELRIAAARNGIHLADDPVTASGRVELRHYLREQAVSETTHRFGNLVRR
ncbi:bifunctional proline dehydrogenase/L-glutamate gamma-semialdehyde dehydrogenase [Actinospongicola halichondriae]|uniref:bifunctional proline dehydrogenase/L-glutamate gamma-semialdehyde dehydrogenase n=1 Tax=Actinospongicola halichondriae TaxID=3236844 RepID=UPI003D51B481